VWRVVSVGPGSREARRRVTDKGPWQEDEVRANGIAAWLRSTGLYESVVVEGVATPESERWAPPEAAEPPPPAPEALPVAAPEDPEASLAGVSPT
jgi:hypothetical protein